MIKLKESEAVRSLGILREHGIRTSIRLSPDAKVIAAWLTRDQGEFLSLEEYDSTMVLIWYLFADILEDHGL